ncbi:hypothetical protein IFM89_014895 [Coptis chinensis]|uniref:EF-hand domain-containing protein n=1 Tax=Coptis chinensis TaxID=261450 RepID=A0A835LF50_9MAGN|nr:hypothetical protein IFM89_014895 [Coptis chinensis]
MNSIGRIDEEVEKIFKHYDANGDGKISKTELANVLRALGSSEPSGDELRLMMKEIDTDGDGFIDLKEFAEFFHKSKGSVGDSEKELKDAFDMYDKDKNGLISVNELHMVYKSLGQKCSVGDCKKMIKNVDRDGDGCVNFDEFKTMMGSGKF